jgi:hypothetical protein
LRSVASATLDCRAATGAAHGEINAVDRPGVETPLIGPNVLEIVEDEVTHSDQQGDHNEASGVPTSASTSWPSHGRGPPMMALHILGRRLCSANAAGPEAARSDRESAPMLDAKGGHGGSPKAAVDLKALRFFRQNIRGQAQRSGEDADVTYIDCRSR